MAKTPTIKEQHEVVDQEILEEMKKWEADNIDPANMNINTFLLETKIAIMIDFIKTLMDDKQREQFELAYKTKLLNRLQEYRPMALASIEEMKREMLRQAIMRPNGAG